MCKENTITSLTVINRNKNLKKYKENKKKSEYDKENKKSHVMQKKKKISNPSNKASVGRNYLLQSKLDCS